MAWWTMRYCPWKVILSPTKLGKIHYVSSSPMGSTPTDEVRSPDFIFLRDEKSLMFCSSNPVEFLPLPSPGDHWAEYSVPHSPYQKSRSVRFSLFLWEKRIRKNIRQNRLYWTFQPDGKQTSFSECVISHYHVRDSDDYRTVAQGPPLPAVFWVKILWEIGLPTCNDS